MTWNNIIHILELGIDLGVPLIILSVMVILMNSNNPVISVACMIIIYLLTAYYLFYIGLAIFSLMYVIIYIGGISILFLFVISSLDLTREEMMKMTRGWKDIAMYVWTALGFYTIFIWKGYKIKDYLQEDIYLHLILTDGFILNNFNLLHHIGYLMLTRYAIWLLLIGFILLLSIIGVIAVTMRNKG